MEERDGVWLSGAKGGTQGKTLNRLSQKKTHHNRPSETRGHPEHGARWDEHPHAFAVLQERRKLSFLLYMPFVLRRDLFTNPASI